MAGMNWSYWLGWTFFRSAFRALFGFRVVNRDKLLSDGPLLIAANHESFLDPPLVGVIYQKALTMLARKTLFRGFPGLLYRSWGAIPVDQERPDMTSLKTIVRRIRGGEMVLVFPEGARTWDGSLGKAQPGIGLIVAKSGAVVQPMRIRGAREALPRGSVRLRMSRVTVTVGDPIRFDAKELKAAKGREGYQKIADRIMDEIAAL
jgi:1-acyl-sn-glycerol-3-phosphate acyltransferase